MERELARVTDVHIKIEDYGCPVIAIRLEYEDGVIQGLGWGLNPDFVKAFMGVFGEHGRLGDIIGKVCWATHDNDNITKLEPLFTRDGEPFDLVEFKETKDAQRKAKD